MKLGRKAQTLEHRYEDKFASFSSGGKPGKAAQVSKCRDTGRHVFSPVDSCVGLWCQVCCDAQTQCHMYHLSGVIRMHPADYLWQLSQTKLGVLCQEPPLNGFTSTVSIIDHIE